MSAVLGALLALTAGSEVTSAVPPAAPPVLVGTRFDVLEVGQRTYRHAQVRSFNARTLVISHDGGVASVRLRDLNPELRAAFGYDPAAEASADAELRAAQSRASAPRGRPTPTSASPGRSGAASSAAFERLMQSFGKPPEVRAVVDFRPKYFELGLNVKNQGIRPSCAVFAIVSALEFQNAQLTGRPELFSEEYLLWATCQTLSRPPRVARLDDGAEADGPAGKEVEDEGFALAEVVTALRAYGIPLQTRMPYRYGRGPTAENPPEDIVEEARSHQRVSVIALPGREPATRVANLLHALNAGWPVAIGVRWPPGTLLAGGYLSAQEPRSDGGHAVTVVGYENKTGAIADTVFIFKNSWGIRWGSGGYGYATYAYLLKNLHDAVLLEVSPGPSR